MTELLIVKVRNQSDHIISHFLNWKLLYKLKNVNDLEKSDPGGGGGIGGLCRASN